MSSGPMKQWIRTAALAAIVAVPLAAAAQDAIVSLGGNLRAGPDRSYPIVAQLPPGTPATVMGCIGGYAWCDTVVPGGLRGWLYGGRLNYVYNGAPVPMLSIGAAIGVPIVTFSLDAYWGNYYRDRPWYNNPRWWGGRRPPPLAGWRRPGPPAGPSWRPRTPPANWRAPAARGGPVVRGGPAVQRGPVVERGPAVRGPAVERGPAVREAPRMQPQRAPAARQPERQEDRRR